MKYLIAVPCMDMMHTQFVCSLISQPPLDGQTEITFGANSLVYDTRNQLTDKAIREGFDRVLWLDSDMTFKPDFSHRLAKRLDEGYEFVTGLYMTRKKPIRPVIFEKLTEKPEEAEFFKKYPKRQIFQIAACGFGGCMVTVDLLKRVMETFGRPFSPMLGYGEDVSFCIRAGLLGAKLYCDSSIKMGHIAFQEITEDTYIERIKNEQKKNTKNAKHGEGRAPADKERSMAD